MIIFQSFENGKTILSSQAIQKQVGTKYAPMDIAFVFFLMFSIVFIFLLLFNNSCPHFPPLLSLALPTPTSHFPPLILPPFGFVHGSFILIPWQPFPVFPLLSQSPQPSGYCQFVLYFNVSGSILLACLFCWLSSTFRWDHMVFVFHHLAYFI